jgi:hypothetical protein
MNRPEAGSGSRNKKPGSTSLRTPVFHYSPDHDPILGLWGKSFQMVYFISQLRMRCQEKQGLFWLLTFGGKLMHRPFTICYDPTLITKPETFHIQTISAIFAGSTIREGFGK